MSGSENGLLGAVCSNVAHQGFERLLGGSSPGGLEIGLRGL